MLFPLTPAGAFDEDPSHCFGGGAEEVSAVLPGGPLLRDAQPSFMDQGSGLQRVPGPFVGHFLGGQAAQVLLDLGQQAFGSLWFALCHGL